MLKEYALIEDTEEAWEFLGVTEAQRNVFEPMMEDWINAASFSLERHLNRPIKPRVFDVFQDGNGFKTLYLDYYPVITLDTIEVSTYDLGSTYVLNPERSAKHLVLDPITGELAILPFAPVGHFYQGKQNIHLIYLAGFADLEPFKMATKELLAIYWREIGTHPLEFVRSDNIGNNVSFTKFDPRRLPFITQQLINNFRRVEA